MVLGEDAEGIAAAALYTELDGPGNVEVESMAVALRHRGHGGSVADALFNELLSRIDERAVLRGVASVLVSGRIYGLNVPSQRMALRAKMRHVDTFDNGVQEWVLSFPTSLVEEHQEEPQLF